jgi:nucleoside-diphosphate-sugar epimerase
MTQKTLAGHRNFITGSAGLIGSHLVERLAGDNDIVISVWLYKSPKLAVTRR